MRRARKTPLSGNASSSEWRFPLSECHCGGGGGVRKLAKYLRNRAPGLVLAQKSVLPRLEALAEPWSAQAVSLACICWYLVRALHKRPARARYRALSRHLLGAYGALQDQLGAASASLLEAVEAVLHQRHRGVQCDAAPLSLCAQGRHPGLSRAVPCLVQSAHAALGKAQGDQRPRVPDRAAGPRLAHVARLSALADARITCGRGCALTSLDSLTPSTVCLGTGRLVCVKMNYPIFIGAVKTPQCWEYEEARERITLQARVQTDAGIASKNGRLAMTVPRHRRRTGARWLASRNSRAAASACRSTSGWKPRGARARTRLNQLCTRTRCSRHGGGARPHGASHRPTVVPPVTANGGGFLRSSSRRELARN